MNVRFLFDVEAGKFDGGLLNCKYCDSFDSSGDAVAAYERVADYPWARLGVIVIVDDEQPNPGEVLVRNYPKWRDVWHDFHSDALSWTEAFEALMSECGMPMEQALQCLAENFDRRPPVEM